MRVALFISGSGTTACAVIDAVQSGHLSRVEIVGVIASHLLAGGIKKVKRKGIRVEVIDPKSFSSREQFGEHILRVLSQWRVEFVSQNGWLPLTPSNVVRAYDHAIINQHPGPLDPGHADFGGKGMWGARVTCARIAYCWLTHMTHPWTEATTHWVSDEYDKGDIIRIERLQFSAFKSTLTPEALIKKPDVLVHATGEIQATLLPLEHANVIESLRLISVGKIPSVVRRHRLIARKNIKLLEAAKHLGITTFPNG